MSQRTKNTIRVDRWVKSHYPSLTQRQIKEALQAGLICSLDHKGLSKGARIESDRELNCQALDFHLRSLQRGNAKLKIQVVHEEEQWLAIDKPAGVSSQPISLFDCDTVTNWALHNRPAVSLEFTEIQPVLVPHRLDIGTSGLLIVAKTKNAFTQWRKEFSLKKICKKYLAWCWGDLGVGHRFKVENRIGHDPRDRRKMTTGLKLREPSFLAHIEVEVMVNDGSGKILCLVTCNSGVTHQVRVQLASYGLPLIGDSLYDPLYDNRGFFYSYHQLRAHWLSSPWGELEVDSSKFTEIPK